MPGTNLASAVQPISTTLWIRETEPYPTGTGDILLAMSAECIGTPPTTANTFHHGCTLTQLDTATGTASLYENTGSAASVVWTLVGTSSPGTISLANTHILVGNSSNVAVDVAMSSEATIANTGAVTLTNSAVIGKVLTGYVSGAGTVAATDTILSAFNKINGNVTALSAAGVGGALTAAHIIVGSAGGVATDTAMSGDITISTTGVTAIGSGKVLLANLGSGITPSHVVKYAGKITWSGSGATLATTVNGVAATDIVMATIQGAPSQAAYLVSAAPTTNTITLVLSAANTSNDAVIAYQVLRAAS